MKQISLIFLMFFLLTACESDKKAKSNNATEVEALAKDEGFRQLKGEFIYVEGSAVLKGRDFIYGVVIDDMANELIEQTNQEKIDEYDMIPVLIKGNIIDNTEEGWEKLVEVKEILRVYPPSNEDVIRVESAIN
jgi:hypothetical protein